MLINTDGVMWVIRKQKLSNQFLKSLKNLWYIMVYSTHKSIKWGKSKYLVCIYEDYKKQTNKHPVHISIEVLLSKY